MAHRFEYFQVDDANIKPHGKVYFEFDTKIAHKMAMARSMPDENEPVCVFRPAFIESTFNTFVGQRFGKRQKTRRPQRGGHIKLQP